MRYSLNFSALVLVVTLCKLQLIWGAREFSSSSVPGSRYSTSRKLSQEQWSPSMVLQCTNKYCFSQIARCILNPMCSPILDCLSSCSDPRLASAKFGRGSLKCDNLICCGTMCNAEFYTQVAAETPYTDFINCSNINCSPKPQQTADACSCPISKMKRPKTRLEDLDGNYHLVWGGNPMMDCLPFKGQLFLFRKSKVMSKASKIEVVTLYTTTFSGKVAHEPVNVTRNSTDSSYWFLPVPGNLLFINPFNIRMLDATSDGKFIMLGACNTQNPIAFCTKGILILAKEDKGKLPKGLPSKVLRQFKGSFKKSGWAKYFPMGWDGGCFHSTARVMNLTSTHG